MTPYSFYRQSEPTGISSSLMIIFYSDLIFGVSYCLNWIKLFGTEWRIDWIVLYCHYIIYMHLEVWLDFDCNAVESGICKEMKHYSLPLES